MLIQQRSQSLQRIALDLMGILGWLQVGVAVALLVRQKLSEEVGEMGQYFCCARRAEADRIGHAGVFGGAEMGQARRQVKHVARFQNPFVGALEVGQDTQVAVLQQRAFTVAHLADAPASLAMGLQQEYIVVVEMRADAATRRGVADHHVVDAPVRQETEVLEQLGDFRDQLIHGLHQQGPVTFRQLLVGIFGERTATQFPRAVAMLDDQTGFDFLFERKAGQFVRGKRVLEIRNGLADQQRFLLPVVAQEFPGADAAQDLQWNIRGHA